MSRTLLALAMSTVLSAQSTPAIQRLVAAYPDHLQAVESNALVWRDGTRMVFDDGRRVEDPGLRLDQPSLYYQMLESYPKGDAGIPPKGDPGRVRFAPFFFKMYGRTREEVEKNLVAIRWLPNSANLTLRITRINGVDKKLQAVSDSLEALPERFRIYFAKPAGTFNWRPIAGTERLSAHSFGIAIDLDPTYSDYWQWAKGKGAALPAYRNRLPLEIVKIFEKHGFIWGGKWSHFDTMHFEYRPELLAP